MYLEVELCVCVREVTEKGGELARHRVVYLKPRSGLLNNNSTHPIIFHRNLSSIIHSHLSISSIHTLSAPVSLFLLVIHGKVLFSLVTWW